MSTKIQNIFCHHIGGLEGKPNYHTQNFTAEQVEQGHKERWNFISSLGRYGGYNFFIEVSGKLTQFRAIGEETAAQVKYNLNSVSICLAGNFTPGVELPTPEQVKTLQGLLVALQERNLTGLQVVPGTEIDIPLQNILPHRVVAMTDCNGLSLPDTWARNLLIPYIQLKITLLQRLILLYTDLIARLRAKPVGSLKAEPCWLEDNRG